MFSRAVINTSTNTTTSAAATTTNTVIDVIQLLGILTYSELFYIISWFPKIHPSFSVQVIFSISITVIFDIVHILSFSYISFEKLGMLLKSFVERNPRP